ncbi:MAG: DUF3971 domain-containing protein [Candidatus Sumerlaeaceae bacterium]
MSVLVAAALAYLWNYPIRADWVHQRIVTRLRKAAGVDVIYDSASLDLPRRLYQFRNLRFSDPKQPGRELLSIANLAVRVRPLAMLMGAESPIREIEITQPSLLDLRYDRSGLHLGPKLAFLARTTRRTADSNQGSARRIDLPLESFRIRDAKIQFEEVTTSPESQILEIRPSAVLVGDVTARSTPDGHVIAKFSGTGFAPPDTPDAITGRPIASDIKATAAFARAKDHDKLELSGSIQSASLAGLFSNLPATAASGTNVDFELKAQRQPDSTSVQLAFDAGGLDVTSGEHAIDIHDEHVRGNLRSHYDVRSGELQVDEAKISSSLVDAESSGSISTGADHPYNINIAAIRLDGGYRKLLTRFLPRGWNVTAPATGVEFNTNVTGNKVQLTKLSGQLRFLGVAVTTPHLRQPVRDMSGLIDLSTQTLSVHYLAGRHGETSVTLAGDIRGDFLRRREGQVNLAWNTSSTADDLMDLLEAEKGTAIPGKTPVKTRKPKSRGTIAGKGIYQQFVSLSDAARTLPPQVEGTVIVRGAGLSHQSLPAPLENLNGSMHIDGDRLLIDTLSGSLRDTDVAISGLIKGRSVFWNDPELSASVVTKFDLAQFVSYLPAEQKKIILKHRISGEATSRLNLNGSLRQLADATFAGSVQLRNIAFQPGVEFMAGGFTNLNGDVLWDGHALRMQDLQGKLNGEPIRATGLLSPDAVSIDLDGTADLAGIIKTFPQLEKWLEMSGPAKYDVRFGIGDPDATVPAEPSPLPLTDTGADTSGNRLASLFAQLSPRLEDAVAARQYRLTGQVEFQGSNMRHRAMPPERTEGGRHVPRGEVRNMRGIARIENDVFRIAVDDVVECDFADTKNCRLSGTLQLREKDLPKMKMAVAISSGSTLRLDSWITGWGMELPKPPEPPQTGKAFELDAEIRAPSILYKEQRAGNSRASINFQIVQNDSPRRTTFSNVEISGSQPGLGSLTGGGTIESFVWKPREFPRWKTEVQIDRMPLESMLTAIFKERTTLAGIVQSGSIELSGVGADAERISGGGSATLRDLSIGATPVFQQIGQQTGRSFGGRSFQTASAAQFQIGNGALSSRDLQLQTNGLSMDLRGDYFFAGNRQQGIPEKTIRGLLKLNVLESVFGKIPLLGPLAQFGDQLAGNLLLAFQVSGNADHPQIAPIALPLFSGALPVQ